MLITRRYRAHRKSFAHMKNLLEAYDNLAVMTILDGPGGLFELKCHISMSRELATVVNSISKEVDLVEL
ncbi:MAG: DUF4911 domain-containing protein [Deltaproteobacteria bacterium]|nr:DUF4911 domain-containing protein [Deltaproteobacteria bacterium]